MLEGESNLKRRKRMLSNEEIIDVKDRLKRLVNRLAYELCREEEYIKRVLKVMMNVSDDFEDLAYDPELYDKVRIQLDEPTEEDLIERRVVMIGGVIEKA
jgi:nitrogen-specific signal transduction histidine kinase